jgi:hypothetical protein
MQMAVRFVTLSVLYIFSCISSPLRAQYYYKDIWNLSQLHQEFEIVKAQHIRAINIKSFENTGEASDGFRCQKKIKNDYLQSEMISKSNITGESLLVTDYNKEGKITGTTDNTPTTISHTQYEYDNVGRLTLVKISTKADDDTTAFLETREYQYADNQLPTQMIRKKNNVPVTTIAFIQDDKGNIVEENIANTIATDRKYYYYYDEKNRLTDVVHFNELAGKLLPDYIYEYDDSDRPAQMISASEAGNNYFIWRYNYNDKNLRESEICYSKEKKFLGRIVYEYK